MPKEAAEFSRAARVTSLHLCGPTRVARDAWSKGGEVEQWPHYAARSQPRAHEARGGASPELPESDRRPHHGVCRVDELRVPAHSAVRCLDALPGGKALAHAHARRLIGGDLPLDVRHDQPEPGGREATG